MENRENQIREEEASRWRGFSLGSPHKRDSPFKTEWEIRELARAAERGLGILDEERDLWHYGSKVFEVWVERAEKGDRNAARNLLFNLQLQLNAGERITPPVLAKWVADCLCKTLEMDVDMDSAFSLTRKGTGFGNRLEYRHKKSRAIEVWKGVEIIRLNTGQNKLESTCEYEVQIDGFMKTPSLSKFYQEGRRLIERYLADIQKPGK